MEKRIRCSIDNCHYWTQGNVCGAEQIMITSDAMGAQMPDSFDASQADNAAGTPAKHCYETCCKTFTESGSGDENLDGIQPLR